MEPLALKIRVCKIIEHCSIMHCYFLSVTQGIKIEFEITAHSMQ